MPCLGFTNVGFLASCFNLGRRLMAQSGYNVLLLRYLKPDAQKLPFQVSSC